MNSTLLKLLKGIAGVIVLVVLITTVNRWWGEYKASDSPAGAPIATSTAAPEGEGESKGETDGSKGGASKDVKTVVVLTDGLNFRAKPSRDGKVIRGLDEGEKLVLIKTQDGWHNVEDKDKVKGWISANPNYSDVK